MMMVPIFERSNEIDEEVTEKKGSNEEENNDANAQVNTLKLEPGIMIQIQIVIWFLFGWISDQSTLNSSLHSSPENISFEESPAEQLYELTFIKYLGNHT